MRSFASIRVWVATTLLAGAALVGRAAEDSATSTEKKDTLPWEKGAVKLGGVYAAFDSKVGFGVNNRTGATLDGEDLLGLDDHLTVFRADAMYRPGKSLRNQLDFTYASYDRDGSATLSKAINIRGTTYPVGARVDSTLNFDIIRGTYSYALLQTERIRVAVGLGIYAIPLEYGLKIQTGGGRSSINGADTVLPVPAVALRGEFQVLPKLFLNAGIDGMYLDIDDFQGSLLDVNVGVEYRPWKYVGFGVGYNFLSVQVEGQDSSSNYPGADFVGTADVRFSGVLFYGKFSF